MKSILNIILLSLILVQGQAFAAFITSTGPVDFIAPPPSVEHQILESDTQIHVFNEQSGVTLTSDLLVNGSQAGQFTPITLSSGTTVNSHMVHVDPETFDPENNNVISNATITFDTAILGLIWISADLDTSDSLFGATGVLYPTGTSFRGAGNAVPGSDIFFVDPFDNTRLIIDTIVTGFGTGDGAMDQVRVLTAVPVPAALWLFLSGITGLITISKRHNQR